MGGRGTGGARTDRRPAGADRSGGPVKVDGLAVVDGPSVVDGPTREAGDARGAAAGDRLLPPPAGQVSPAPAPSSRANPVTVLEVLPRMDLAGETIRAVNLLRRLDPAEFRLLFCVTSGAPGSLDEEIRSLGGEVYYCRADPSFPFAFHRLLRRVRPDIVHSGVATFSGVVLTVARAAGVRRRVAHFFTSTDRRGDSVRGRFQRALGRVLLDAFATDLIAVSEAAMRGLWRESWRLDPRCRVIYNGVELEPFGVAIAGQRPMPSLPELDELGDVAPPPLTVLHIARPDPVKNRSRAIEIVAAMCTRGLDVRLRFVGRQSPEETERLMTLAGGLGVSDRVEFLGERGDVPKLLVNSSLLLVTSLHEGLPSVVLEACAVGTPVLSSDLPGVAEIARVLPGITMLPLGTPNEIWASTAADLAVVPPTLDERREAMRRLRRSPFTMENWQRDITAVWS
ncbi:Glycosyltransferase involved in cell wall bisynthesis [Parafrankia irregularis]|uniref:Glycosyltransferase involved in cell wall bisynthesis n=1 Tax=Parafrankia irregularis TaxID=795642 RepID=A0A0S4QGV7_9ACTN|nr:MULTISPECIES: glycosyltransferase [Parafrankia]MBE3199564.1 glycosyltransferase [Parafrankia sp. CH37]CUU53770.1 Glycosyltransferase involved in cell wall bisynthesis [Parafrankia irregularis]